MNYLSKSSLCLLAVVTSLTATAQETLSDKLQYKVTGRMLMDGGVYLRNDNHFGNGTEFNDLRVGMKATYQRWDMKVEIGYVGKSPGSVLAMTNSRRLGVAYTYNATHYYACGGLFTDNDISNLKNTSQGYAVDGRFVYRPVNETGKLLHLGIAAIHRTPDGALPDDDNRNTFVYKSAGVSTIDNRNLIYAEVDNAHHQVKLGTELLIYYGKFFLQSEYIRTQVKRRNGLADYTGQGGYAQCSWLLIGDTYDYDAALACPARPIGRALELCGRFNIVDMNDRTAEVLGGAQKDFSLGLNYYINKHIGIKVNYSYVIPGKHIREISDNNFSVLQARFQFIL